ncbi:50S ribosomal protein L14 [bacterium (Candidatus Torokbacteria) CG_4_10_14_0_2_um_filter_35_8]|nr:MAG: 50S ribosomal protein L14 [bacterium (Candidatus Torokbacteria) CG_4_10_14_0_2_um_filter_35_8]
MIQEGTKLKVVDNTGAQIAKCIRILGHRAGSTAGIGDKIIVSIKDADPRGQVKTHEVCRAVIVRTKKELRRKDGSYIRFDENACVILDKETDEPKGTRVFGPIPRELRDVGHIKIINLAPEVL